MRFHLFKSLFCLTFILLIIYKLQTYRFHSRNCSSNETKTSNGLEKHDPSDISNRREFVFNRFIPLVFVAGVPGSGSNFMSKILNEDKNIRCSDNFGLINEIILKHNEWTKSKIEKQRLLHASMTDKVIDEAMIAFILNLVLKPGKVTKRFCSKDNRIMNHAKYMKKLFPNIKFIFMIRDARSTSITLFKTKILINKAKIDVLKDILIDWNKMMEKMYSNCLQIGLDTCLPIYYENLLLEPEKTMKHIFKFVNLNRSYILTRNQILAEKHKQHLWYRHFPSNLTSQLNKLAPYFFKLGYKANSLYNYSYLLARKNHP